MNPRLKGTVPSENARKENLLKAVGLSMAEKIVSKGGNDPIAEAIKARVKAGGHQEVISLAEAKKLGIARPELKAVRTNGEMSFEKRQKNLSKEIESV